MIRNRSEYEGAQRELGYLKDFLAQVESAPDDPNRELGIIGIYKKMYSLWEELEEYYCTRLAEAQQWGPNEQRGETAPVGLSD
jgi:hypothetical protein